jgi:hypothetical protein
MEVLAQREPACAGDTHFAKSRRQGEPAFSLTMLQQCGPDGATGMETPLAPVQTCAAYPAPVPGRQDNA